MEKKILTLCFAIVITFASAYAEDQYANPLDSTNTPNNYNLPTYNQAVFEKSKCSDLVERIMNNRPATYNVLNLTPQQRKYMENIEKCRFEELDKKINVLEQEIYVLKKLQCNPQANASAIKQQEKVIKNTKKEIDKIAKKYDKEFKAMLSGEQKAKYNFIQRMKKKDIKRCSKKKPLYKQDPHFQEFGKPYLYDEDVCPKHGIKHWFKRKCTISE